ncbi:quinoprotein dehydrogenase-associated SoxYZ-like carrier [Thiobaca trueperi]|uniref:Sulfur-oxidizing protein SoxY n=1 Tax=Thiobaca trueperi TaxID=127458 RepID=A0A4R3MTK4_9GAMM|nr:quinoprotein dehydrogenase-associated SoxYZ-like carrier [Thiobaca trueperi]TCT19768.1 sulfur-oxidizing protein SoxY [Thiobaca trueperi]
MQKMALIVSAAMLLALPPIGGLADDSPRAGMADPLGSPRWENLRRAFFGDAEVVFDDRVKVNAPAVADEPLNVPVAVDASALTGVEEVLVLVDFNPIVRALRFEPGEARASLAFRLKLNESTPIRAAVRTADGVWHLGGARVTTSGGACTQPSAGSGASDWQQDLNQVGSRLWQRPDGSLRLRLRIVHPMDTGLAKGIPVFYIETLEITAGDGRSLMRIEPAEPVAENPVFTLDIPPGLSVDSPLRIAGRDNNGNLIHAETMP